MLFVLAIIPVIALLIFIYKRDMREKEPIGLLIGIFFAGMASIIPAIIVELIGMLILGLIFYYEPFLQAIFLAFLVIGPAEEAGKFLALRLITWKNKHFDHSYDAIVYAVCSSLGFACLENINYVFDKGVGVAIVRMLTSVPGHACFGVLMGFFYSKAKYASLTNDKKGYRKNIALSLIVPMLLHGVFDAILLGGEASGDVILTGLALVLWIIYVIALLVLTFILVIHASKNDYCIITIPDETQTQTVYKPTVVGNWTCSCGHVNQFSFCAMCGQQRPVADTWHCPSCGTLCTFKFCGNCGFPKPTTM